MVWEQSWKPADIPLCQRAGLQQVAVQSCSPVCTESHCCDPFPTAGVVLGVGLEAFRLGCLGRHAQPSAVCLLLQGDLLKLICCISRKEKEGMDFLTSSVSHTSSYSKRAGRNILGINRLVVALLIWYRWGWERDYVANSLD